MWESFDGSIEPQHRMWKSVDAAGELVPEPNKMTSSDPGEETIIVLRSSPRTREKDATAEPQPEGGSGGGGRRRSGGGVSLQTLRADKVKQATAPEIVEPGTPTVVSALHCCPITRKEWEVAPVRPFHACLKTTEVARICYR
eukprot:SAG31_NODE_1581_length_7834_cov_11.737298_3_plen_142_part_00